MEAYVDNSALEEDDINIFQYLYFLSKKYAIHNRYRLSSESLEAFAIQCSCQCFEEMRNSKCSFKEAFNKLSYPVRRDLNAPRKEFIDTRQFLFKNHIIDLLEYNKFDDYSDICNFTDYINKVMGKLPKKKLSSEWYNLYMSVCYSLYFTLLDNGVKIFTNLVGPKLHIVIIGLPDFYSAYVRCIVSLLIFNVRDSFNKTTSSKSLNIHSLALRELLNS